MKRNKKFIFQFTDNELSLINTCILQQQTKLLALSQNKDLDLIYRRKMWGLNKKYHNLLDYINKERIKQNEKV